MSSESSFVLVENETNTTEYHLASLFITYCKSRDERLTRKTAELIVTTFNLQTKYFKTNFFVIKNQQSDVNYCQILIYKIIYIN